MSRAQLARRTLINFPRCGDLHRYTIGPTEGFAAAGAFAGFQVLVLVVMRMWCRPTKLVRAPVTPRRHKEAKHSREEWLDKLRDKIKVILEVRLRIARCCRRVGVY